MISEEIKGKKKKKRLFKSNYIIILTTRESSTNISQMSNYCASQSGVKVYN